MNKFQDLTGKIVRKSCHAKFLDSLKFLNSSLDVLSKNLLDKGKDNFVYCNKEFPSHFDLCTRKGVFPYDFVTSESVLDSTISFPQKKNFYSKLLEKNISDSDYEFGKKVWDTFSSKSLREYRDLYLKIDVCLLADIFEQFRKCIFKEYQLDPVYYLTLPALSLDCALKISNVKLELVSDSTIYNFLECGIRGGVSMICTRYAKANNKFLKDFDSSKESSFIVYKDENNLYGKAMLEPLPVSDFHWFDKEMTLENVRKIRDCIVSVDLSLDKSLWEKFKDFPLCPEHVDNKLLTTFYKKKNYVCHSRYLFFVLDQGYTLEKINKILCFKSEPWLKCYIEKNTKLRSEAISSFVKDLWKIMNNSVFGKLIENVREHTNIKLSNSIEKFVKKPNFKNIMSLENDNFLIEMRKNSVTLNKPIYGGLAILDFSKIVTGNFFYNYLVKKFGTRYQLLMTDTDSFLGLVYSEDFYQEISGDVETWFDTSNIPENLFKDFPTGKNKKVPGMFKDEMAGIPISSFVGLRAKQYAYQFEEGKTQMKCKGVNKQAMKKIRFEDYICSMFKRKLCFFKHEHH